MDGTLAKDPVEKAEPTNDRCKMALELGTQQHTMQHGKRKSREQRKQQPSHGAAQVQLEVREVVEPPRNELHLERQTTTRRHTREREREQESEWLGRSWTSIDRSLACSTAALSGTSRTTESDRRLASRYFGRLFGVHS